MKWLPIRTVILAAIGSILCLLVGPRSLENRAIAESVLGSAPLRCIAFSPYVAGYDPELGPHPPQALIDTLLDNLIRQTRFRCIMIYGLLNGVDYIIQAAEQRGLKVIMIAWLDICSIPTDPSCNDPSIQLGIQRAQQHSNTVIRVSCGSELLTRWLYRGASRQDIENTMTYCISKFRNAGVTQPITSIDTWWEWCNESYPCQQWSLLNDVDWIGINVFPWWENVFSGIFSCTHWYEAAAFHIARFQDVINAYPGKEVVLTEFGWPGGPKGYKNPPNPYTGQQCGVAGEFFQTFLIVQTLAEFNQMNWSGVVFEAYREPWKARPEGPVGPFWGICQGTPPYGCKFVFRFLP